jgi:hypothetical protein
VDGTLYRRSAELSAALTLPGRIVVRASEPDAARGMGQQTPMVGFLALLARSLAPHEPLPLSEGEGQGGGDSRAAAQADRYLCPVVDNKGSVLYYYPVGWDSSRMSKLLLVGR